MEQASNTQDRNPSLITTQTLRQQLNSAGIPATPGNLRVLERLYEALDGTAFEHLLQHLLPALQAATDSPRVLAGFERLLLDGPAGRESLALLIDQPRSVEILARLFAGSQFLTEVLLRHPGHLARLQDHRSLAYLSSAEGFEQAAQREIVGLHTYQEQLDALRRYQRWELLRIGLCDLLGLFDLPAVTGQLALLAESLVQVCLELASQQTGIPAEGFFVLGMGKLGGGELNYSSDVDLLFLTTSDPARQVRLAERLIHNLVSVTAEGFLYRVDMRLRPWGSVGALVSSVDGYRAYLAKHARLWERQALLKAHPIAGDRPAGRQFLEQIAPQLFAGIDGDSLRRAIQEMKARTEAQLQRRGQAAGEVKLGEGSIRDAEFVTQYLQLRHGLATPAIRQRSTLPALDSLLAHGLIPAADHQVLASGYTFLRAIEHHLQLMDYRQTHILPTSPDALSSLAQRLGFDGPQAGEQLILRYTQHSAAIRGVYLAILGSEPMPDTLPHPAAPEPDPEGLSKHLARLDPAYELTFSPADIRQHAQMASRLDSTRLVEIDTVQLEDGRWRVTVVAYDYLGELSLICGLMFVNGLNILGGEVFTYEPAPPGETTAAPRLPRRTRASSGDTRRKIVDVFTVEASQEPLPEGFWERYRTDLAALLQRTHAGDRRGARGELAIRAAAVMDAMRPGDIRLERVHIEIDNQSAENYTVLHIDAQDTPGFLYELTNALAYTRTNIVRVQIGSAGQRVEDTLYVTDDRGHKITDPQRQQELRAAIVLIKQFTHLLPHSPNPASALLHFREFIAQLFQRPNWTAELTSLERPEVLDGLARLLGVSDFLWEDFLRMQYANLFPVVRDVDELARPHSRPDLQAALEEVLARVHPQPQPPDPQAGWVQALNAFKDREMFRIDMRQILGHTQEFAEFSEELTDLAEVVINAAFHLTGEDLRSVYGTPRFENGAEVKASVLALGKCGGRELGFASDIELMIVYAGNGQTDGPNPVSAAEFYEKLVESFMRTIHSRHAGSFEIDLQLRPYGKAGSLAVSLDAFRRYFSLDGPAWAYERQALLRLRTIAGDVELGGQVEGLRDGIVYSPGAFDRTAMRAMRERQLRHLVAAGTFHPKFSPGGLVDVEYLVQGLQMIHGADYPRLRTPNTRAAMQALHASGLLTEQDYTHLRKAHTFLRWLIESLRVVSGSVKDTVIPAEDSEAFAFLAQRMRYGKRTALLTAEIRQYAAWVQEINRRLLG